MALKTLCMLIARVRRFAQHQHGCTAQASNINKANAWMAFRTLHTSLQGKHREKPSKGNECPSCHFQGLFYAFLLWPFFFLAPPVLHVIEVTSAGKNGLRCMLAARRQEIYEPDDRRPFRIHTSCSLAQGCAKHGIPKTSYSYLHSRRLSSWTREPDNGMLDAKQELGSCA